MEKANKRIAAVYILLLFAVCCNAVTESLKNYLKSHENAFDNQLLELSSIPSIATDPAYATDVARAAQWLTQRLEKAGFKVRFHSVR